MEEIMIHGTPITINHAKIGKKTYKNKKFYKYFIL